MHRGNKNKKGNATMSFNSREFSEKRDFIRMQVSTSSTIVINDEKHPAVCTDLSSTGAALTSKAVLKVNDKIEIEVNSGGGETPPLKAEATVLRANEHSTDEFQYGVSIDKFL